jgi:hypothetical protein
MEFNPVSRAAKHELIEFIYFIGLPNRNRTCDPQLRRLMLYPTELWAVCEAALQEM